MKIRNPPIDIQEPHLNYPGEGNCALPCAMASYTQSALFFKTRSRFDIPLGRYLRWRCSPSIPLTVNQFTGAI